MLRAVALSLLTRRGDNTAPLAGHVNPMIAVAEYLSEQGHNVISNAAEIFRSFSLHFQMHASNYLHDWIEWTAQETRCRPGFRRVDQAAFAQRGFSEFFPRRIPRSHHARNRAPRQGQRGDLVSSFQE